MKLQCMCHLKSCMYESMNTAGVDTLLPNFDSLSGIEATFQMEPLVQQLLCSGASLKSVCHGQFLRVEIRQFHSQIRVVVHKLNQSSGSITSGDFQKGSSAVLEKETFVCLLQLASIHSAQRHCFVHIDGESGMFQTVHEMPSTSQQNNEIILTVKNIMLANVICKGSEATLKPLPWTIFMKSNEDLNKVQCP